MRAILLSLFAASLALAGCSSSSGSDDGESQAVTVVFGRLTAAGGAPIAGARVRGGGATATTDADGRYQLDAATTLETTVRFEAEGYLPTVRTTPVLNERPTALDATLVPEAPAQPLDAAAGGTITGARGAQVTVPAGGLVLAVGGSVEGMVDVHLTPLDPTKADELTAGTDAFAGRDEAGRVTLLESYGMVDVTIRQGGEKLQVAPGQTLEIRIPAPEGVTDPPATMPLWSLDEASNVWVQEGEATWDADAGVYVGQIGHMSMWNCDQPATATCITGHVADADGASVPGARVTARGADYNGSTSAVAGEDGRFYIAVRKDSSVAVLASHAAGGGTSRVVQSGSEDTAVPPTPGDPRCLDVGEWVVERGVVRTSDGGTFACDIVNQNPFAGTCASGMIDMFTCFAPAGSCTYEQMGTGATVRWSNGAGLVTQQAGDRFEARYEGPGGRLCGTGGLDFNRETGETGPFALTLTNGQTYTILQDEDDTRWGVRCPSGEEVYFDRADQEALEACGVGGSGESGGISQCAGFPSAGGAGGAGGGGGNPGGLCQGDAECTGGAICCTPDPNQPEIGVCVTQAICDQIIAAQGMQ